MGKTAAPAHSDDEFLFVYGTLMKGLHNNYLMGSDSAIIDDARTTAEYTMLNLGGYPGVCDGGRDEIAGEIWWVPGEILDTIDDMEYRYGYERREITVVLSDESTIMNVNAYILKPERANMLKGSCRSVKDGDWRKHLENGITKN